MLKKYQSDDIFIFIVVLLSSCTKTDQKKAATEITIMEFGMTEKKNVVTADMVRRLFAMFRQFVADKNIIEVKTSIGNYIEKVIIYKDCCKVVFFFSCGDICKTEAW